MFIRFLLKNNGNSKDKKLSDIANSIRALNSREFSLEGIGVDNCFYKLPFDELFNLKNEQSLNKKLCFYCRRFYFLLLFQLIFYILTINRKKSELLPTAHFCEFYG